VNQPALVALLAKEFRTQMRGSRPAVLLASYLALLLLALFWLYQTLVGQVQQGVPLIGPQIGQALFVGLTLAVQLLLVFLAPATTLNSISSEHERHTYDILLATPLSAAGMVLSKLLVGIAFVGLLIVAALPLYSIVVLFGGVAVGDLGRVVLTIISTAITGCTLGLACSVLTRQTYTATLLCYTVLVAVTAGTLFAANIWSALHGLAAAPSSYLVANPLSAVASALGQAQPPGIVTVNALRPATLLGLLTRGSLNLNVNELAPPFFRATWLLYSGVALSLLWVALHTVEAHQHRRFLRFSRSDAWLLGLLVLWAALVWATQAWWQAGLW